MMRDKHLTLEEINARFRPKGLEFVSQSEDASGFVNKTIFLEEKGGKKFVLRLCTTMDQFKHTKTKNEVNILKRAEKITGLLSPKVHDFDTDSNNAFGCEYILMDRLPGKPLGKEIDKLTKEQVVTIMKELVDGMQGMWSQRFDAVGTLDENGKPGPVLLFGGLGPFKTKNEASRAMFGMMIAGGGEAYDKDKEKLTELLEKIMEVDKTESPFICFGHSDLNLDNMLIENGHFTGLVDWEWAGACGFEQEVFSSDFYRQLRYREDFLKILDEKMGFDVHKLMADCYDRNAAFLGTLLLGWYPKFGLTPDDPFVVQWVSELEKLMKKYGVYDGKLMG